MAGSSPRAQSFYETSLVSGLEWLDVGLKTTTMMRSVKCFSLLLLGNERVICECCILLSGVRQLLVFWFRSAKFFFFLVSFFFTCHMISES